jgi:uncharacterized protein YbjT (DUF2867 family)
MPLLAFGFGPSTKLVRRANSSVTPAASPPRPPSYATPCMALPGSGLLRALFPPRFSTAPDTPTPPPPTRAADSSPVVDDSAVATVFSPTYTVPAPVAGPNATPASALSEQRPSTPCEPAIIALRDVPRDVRRVLVVGASGRLGRQVVSALAASPVGYTVVGVVRSLADAPVGCDRVIALDAGSQAPLLAQQARKLGVGAVVWCAAAGRGEKPRDVDFAAVRDFVAAATGPSPGWLADEDDNVPLFDFSEPSSVKAWRPVDDVVMGGMSQSVLRPSSSGTSALWSGSITLARRGGFVSARANLASGCASGGVDLSSCSGIAVVCRGDGKRYKLNLKNDTHPEFVFQASFDTVAAPTDASVEQQWQTIRVPFSDFMPVVRGKLAYADNPADGSVYCLSLDTSSIISVGLVCSKIEPGGMPCPKFAPGPFSLELASLYAYRPASPRFVLVSSAAVTRPFWDEHKKSLYSQAADIPIVKLNAQIGNVLGAKLAGEDALRATAIPYTVLRPTALRDDVTPGQAVRVLQGDVATGRISRSDVARTVVGILQSQDASWKTIELDGDAGKDWTDAEAPDLLAFSLKTIPADSQQSMYPFPTSEL